MRTECGEVEALLERRERGLGEGEQLLIERHLATCASCRFMADALPEVVALLGQEPAGLDAGARERAIGAALDRALSAPAPVRRSTPGLGRWLAFAAAALALLASVYLLQRAEDGAPRVATAPTPVAPAPDAQGELARAPAEPAFSEPSPDSLHVYAHARVRVAAGTRLRFDAASATLELAAGRVEVEVDPRAGASFAVTTRNFRVEVLGTQFTVTPEAVEVQRGRVRVLDLQGAVLAAELRSGERYPNAASRAPAASDARATRTRRVAAVLAQAREALAAGRVDHARSLLGELPRQRATRAERAEAATLGAECALLSRDAQGAIRAYLDVARRFGDLAAGENAAFAAAQLTASQGDATAARELFARYLTRYPAGRFAEEARARLAR